MPQTHDRPFARRPSRLDTTTRALAAIVALAFGAAAAAARTDIVVSQKGSVFAPRSAILHKGDALVIVNDDGDTLHHAYIESDTFNFDSGDQKPGSRTRVVFTVPGDFQVLCGIHPRMKLAVHVIP